MIILDAYKHYHEVFILHTNSQDRIKIYPEFIICKRALIGYNTNAFYSFRKEI